LRVSVTFYYLAKKNADILFYNLSAKSKGALSLLQEMRTLSETR
jgi:hypothetical protein